MEGVTTYYLMKDKNVAGILALFLGWVGIHRFYLGQVGLGIFYVFLFFTGISFILGLIDAIAFFVMDQDNFDLKYNRRFMDVHRKDRLDTDFNRDRRRAERHERREEYRSRRAERPQQRPSHRRPVKRVNPHKQKGIERYKDFDYAGAIEEFNKALEIEERDIAVHFNLACAYSLEEQAEKSFYHLDKAVEFGFQDFKRIKDHDALAFLRIQDGFDDFEENDFRLAGMPVKKKAAEKPAQPQIDAPKEEDLLSTEPDLLDQIKKLGELRDKGLLTEKEFAEQKRRLLG